MNDVAVASVLVAVDPAAAFALFTEDVDAWWQRGPAYRVGGERGEWWLRQLRALRSHAGVA